MLEPARGRPRPSAGRRWPWSRSADASAENRRRARALLRTRRNGGRIGLRRRDRRRQRLRLVLRLRAGILRQFAALDRGVRHRAGRFRLRRKGIGEVVLRKPRLTCRRCSRQNQMTSAPAPRLAVRDASKATRRHGTWLLTRTQQTTDLSKHLPSKQPLNPWNKMLAELPIRDIYSSRAMPGSAGTKRTSTSSLRSKPAAVLTRRIRVWVP